MVVLEQVLIVASTNRMQALVLLLIDVLHNVRRGVNVLFQDKEFEIKETPEGIA